MHHHPEVGKKRVKRILTRRINDILSSKYGIYCGNIREHITEQKTEKILAESVFEDIKKDTAYLNLLIANNYKRLNSIKEVLYMMHQPTDKWNDTLFYRNMSPIMTSVPFDPTDGTYSQMKTSGTLRLDSLALNIVD